MNIGEWYDMTPTVNFASRAVTEFKTQWGPRFIPDFQLVYVVSGSFMLKFGSVEYEAAAGNFLFLGPDVPHLLSAVEQTDYFSLHFCWNERSPIPVHPAGIIRMIPALDVSRAAPSYRLTAADYGELSVPHLFATHGQEPLLMRIVNEYRQERLGYPIVLRALLIELLSTTIRQLADNRSVTKLEYKIEPALAAMRDQPGKNWTVAELADMCGYHPSYFTDLFRREIGKNPKSYLIEQRIRQTKQGLLRGEKLETLADRLGYTSMHYLSNQFKKETGLTPGQYRLTGSNAEKR